ncbi:PASTA domain-containing protein, partial [bacterium]|nr:PASTA domain-containing protein [bacterium]
VKKGRRIYLTISIGEREVEIPNLMGLSETNAQETLRSLGLRLGDREYRYEPNELPKVVIEQSIVPNSYVKLSRPVDIVVSLGRPVDNVTVPSVLAKMLDDAELIIKRSGLTLGKLRYQIENSLMPNTVIGQSKESGTVVAPGDTLDLVVSTLSQQNN